MNDRRYAIRWDKVVESFESAFKAVFTSSKKVRCLSISMPHTSVIQH